MIVLISHTTQTLFTPLLWVLLLISSAFGQKGDYFLHNYTPSDYSPGEVIYGPQNFGIWQDSSNRIYIGNTSNILIYDGYNWIVAKETFGEHFFRFGQDVQGNIYVGGRNNLGFLEADSSGAVKFVSLLPFLPPDKRNISRISSVIGTRDGIFFLSANHLYLWHAGEFHIREKAKNFIRAFLVNGEYWLQDRKSGLSIFKNKSFQTVIPSSELTNLSIKAVVKLSSAKGNSLLLVDRNRGLFVEDEGKVGQLHTELSRTFPNLIVRVAKVLDPDLIALGTQREGIILINRQGDVLRQIHLENGLQNNMVHELFLDRAGILWAALNEGFSRVHIQAPLTTFTIEGDFSKSIQSMNTEGNAKLLGSLHGLYRLTSEGHNYRINKLMDGEVWKIIFHDNQHFIATSTGVYTKKDEKITRISSDPTYSILPFTDDHNRMLLGLKQGISSLRYEGGEWLQDGHIEGLEDQINFLVEDKNGQVFATYRQAYKLDFSKGFSLNPGIDTLRLEEDASEYIEVIKTRDRLLFGTDKGIHIYDPAKDKLVYETHWQSALESNQAWIYKLAEDSYRNLWINYSNRPGRIRRIGQDSLQWDSHLLASIPRQAIWLLFPDRDSVVWIAGEKGLYRYDPKQENPVRPPFPAIISSVQLNKDSSLFWNISGTKSIGQALPYHANQLRFHFAAPSFYKEELHEFQYWLEGNDHNWSAWQQEKYIDFTNLREGDYRFHLRARNIYQQESEASIFAFRIAPPLYRTWWAYACYGVVILILLKLLFDILLKRERKKQAIQLQLMEATQIKELDELKSRFFANISHEFRTPLSLILGPINKLLSNQTEGDPQTYYRLMKRNGERLLSLINQLLDLSKLESGKMNLNWDAGDLSGFVRNICHSFESWAEQKNIRLETHFPSHPLFGKYDADKLEKIIVNLVSNAIKFSPEEGWVRVKLEKIDPEQCIQIEVADSGMGIPQEEIVHIFNRFYQLEGDVYQGTGIGLALVKELVELHKGSISVESEPHKGSIFIVRIPFLTAEQGNLHEYKSPDSADTQEESLEKQPFNPTESQAQILIVEDNSDLRIFIGAQLKKHYHLLEAENGKQGLEIARKYIPDLIISDVMMPEMDGFEFAQQIKTHELTSHISIILLTARAGQESKLEGLETGADAYLTKPFDSIELELRVRKLIEQREKLRKRYSRQLTLQPSEVSISSVDEQFLNKAVSIVETYMEDESFSVSDLAEELALSRTQLFRKIRALTDQSPSVFIRNLRLKRAHSLLSQRVGTISEIAYMTGFNSPQYFNKCFKDQYGISPGEVSTKAKS